MNGYCRLCAKAKSATALKHKFSDLMSKLIECCRWLEAFTESEYPQNVCDPCAKRLDQCWKFTEAVKSAHKNLDDIIAEQRAEQAPATLIKDEEGEAVKVEPDFLSDIDFAMGEMGPTKTEFFDFSMDPENTSDFEWPDNNADVWDTTDAYDDGNDDDDGGAGGKSSVKDESKSEPQFNADLSQENNGEEAKKVTIMIRRQEFMNRISSDARLDDGKINPDQIMELKLCDWTIFKYRCSVCSAPFEDSESLQKHFSSSHSGEAIQWICSICTGVPDQFKNLWQLHTHVANHHYPHLFYCCPKCHIFFWNKKKMRKHCNNKQKHNTNEALPCEVCGKVFRSQLLLKLHHQNVHVPQDRQFECYLCRKPLSKLTVCKAHMKRFHFDGDANQPIFVMCELCGKVCRSSGALSSHMASHNSQESFACDICGKTFKSARGVKKHKICHSNDKQFSCKECDFQTRRIESLRNHMRIHRNERSYECDICFKKFTLSNGLRVHRRIHTGEKPYACTECDYRSVNGPNLNKHMKQRHGTTFFKTRPTHSESQLIHS